MNNPSLKAMSLIEVIISITVFSILMTAGIVMLDQVSKASQKVEMEEYLYTEAQIGLEQIARTIQVSAIDYEELYSLMVQEDITDRPLAEWDAIFVGEHYGEYHPQFFDPGEGGAYGADCSDGTDYIPSEGCNVGSFPYYPSFDYDTGMNPYDGSGYGPEDSNAVCAPPDICNLTPASHMLEVLPLINKTGDKKTIFTLESWDEHYAKSDAGAGIAKVELDGTDTDGNGLIDTWACASGYNCYGTLPSLNDVVDGRDDDFFTPITPKNITIEKLKFYISPLEDPFKGYNETSGTVFDNVQIQPKITIVLEARYQLYDDEGNRMSYQGTANFGDAPQITLQTTVGTGVYEEIPAYSFP